MAAAAITDPETTGGEDRAAVSLLPDGRPPSPGLKGWGFHIGLRGWCFCPGQGQHTGPSGAGLTTPAGTEDSTEPK